MSEPRSASRALTALSLSLLGLALPGCHKDAAEPYTCEVDPALLTQKTACNLDEDCPCGAHCGMGECASECSDDNECEGACDLRFGRCVDNGEEEAPPSVSRIAAPKLSVTPSSLTLLDVSQEGRVRVYPGDGDSGLLRVVASDGLLVQCRAETAFGHECVMQSPDPSEGLLLSVRTDPDATDEDLSYAELRLYSEAGARARVGVALGDITSSIFSHARRAAEDTDTSSDAPRDGVFVGTIRPIGAGVSIPGEDGWATLQDGELVIPVRVEILDGKITLTDELTDGGVLLTGAVGTLAESGGGSYTIDLPATRVMGGESADEPELLMRLVSSDEVEWTANYVSGTLLMEYEGLSAYASPRVAWSLHALYDEDATASTSLTEGTDDALSEDLSDRTDTPLAGEGGEDVFADYLCADSATEAGGGLALVADSTECLSTADVGCGDGLSPWDALPMLRWSVAGDGSADEEAFDAALCTEDLSLDWAGSMDCGASGCGCIDTPTYAAAMAVAFESARARLLYADGYDDAELEQLRVGHRLAQQWLELAGWLPTEALGKAEFAEAYGAVVSTEEPDYQAVIDATSASVHAWNLLLHPRIATALAVLPVEVGAEPDYRGGLLGESALEADTCYDPEAQMQGVGLPVAMLDTLGAQARVLAALIRHGRMAPDAVDIEAVKPLLGEFLRVALPVRGLAEGMVARASEAGELSWQTEWDVASRSYDAALSTALQSLNDDDNPLGIQEVDLPLYGLGEQVGAGSRFFALSANLLGSGVLAEGNVSGYGMESLLDAWTALEDAREAWNDELDRDWSNTSASNDADREVEAVERKYGEPVLSLCGYPAEVSALDILENAESIDPATCYVPNDGLITALGVEDAASADCPDTQMDLETYEGHLSAAGIAESLCVITDLQDLLGPALQTYASTASGIPDEAADWGDQCVQLMEALAADGAWKPSYKVNILDTLGLKMGTADEQITFYRIEVNDVEYLVSAGCYDLGLPEYNGDYDEAIAQIYTDCAAYGSIVDSQGPTTDPTSCSYASDCTVGKFCQTGICTAELSDAPDPSCYRGSLGEAALEVMSAANEVEVARSELAEYTEKYDIAMRSCFLKEEGNDAIEEAIAGHNAVMTGLGAVKLGADVAADMCEAAGDSASLADVTKAPFKLAAGVAKSVSAGLQFGMDTAELDHTLTMQSIQDATDEATCYNDAEMEFVGAKTQALKIQTAMLALSEAMVHFNNLQNEVAGNLSDGVVAVQMEEARRQSPLMTVHWVDENFEIYQDRMQRARRAAWLALRVVEYESQETMESERADILAAPDPEALAQVLYELQDRVRTGTVSGGSPTELMAVVSLKDHLLQLDDRSDFPTNWQTMDDVERFKWWLTSDTFKVNDEDGTWLGQEIPFSLAPRDEDIAALDNIPLRTSTDCAERLWSVNVSILGDGAYAGGASTFGRVVVKKSNSFYSQWCDPDQHDEPFQDASTRPELNLLLDPYDDDWASQNLSTDALLDYTSAQVSAYIGVTQAELEDEAYFNGDSQQLAGRGLYGDYAIFIPAEWIGEVTAEGVVTLEGLNLGAFEDILIRFDYVAIAQD